VVGVSIIGTEQILEPFGPESLHLVLKSEDVFIYQDG
jgi:hypothetical protein